MDAGNCFMGFLQIVHLGIVRKRKTCKGFMDYLQIFHLVIERKQDTCKCFIHAYKYILW